MNKSGKIVLLEPNSKTCGYLCGKLHAISEKNEVLCYSDSNDAEQYLTENVSDVFLVLQNVTSPGLHLPNCRNMVYMHEKFNIESITYMFLVQSKEETPQDGVHTFVHCYYKADDLAQLPKIFVDIIDFWKDHVFPARLTRSQYPQI